MQTIETAICFSTVLIVLTIFIVYPLDLWHKTLEGGKIIVQELDFHFENESAVSTKRFGNHYANDTCPELINTALAGLIDSIEIARGDIYEK